MALPLPKYTVFDSNVNQNRTKYGTHRHKYAIRAGFRVVTFLALLAVFSVYNYFQAENASDVDTFPGRRLSATDGEIYDGNTQDRSLALFQEEADPKVYLVLYIALVLYLFLAIAIVCDEFFVPALEIMVDENHLNMSRDIAGATLMAAGGSAPELFTSIIGTFQRSEIGFGTIVGSAVFNVLFVIGMCSLFSTEVLRLSWWPLFRDCTYYVMGLLVLGIFVGVVSKEVIVWWEAAILFGLYFGYVLVMAFNVQLHKMITGKDLEVDEAPVCLQYPTTFRAGLLTFIRAKETWQVKARIGLLYRISGNFDDVFNKVDSNGDGHIDRDEMANCFTELDTPVTDTELDSIMEDIDSDGDSKVTKSEFKKWYLNSEENMKARVKEVFIKFDTDGDDLLNETEFVSMVEKVDPDVPDAYKHESAIALFGAKNRTEISLVDFTEWYCHSIMFEEQQKNIKKVDDEQNESLCASLYPPKDATLFDYIKWVILFPIVSSLTLTVPNSMRPGMENYCYASFILSICWIGVYSFFMVEGATTIGATVGIPTFIMGLTFLAAGTSVPDLLSSVIVARMGEGDMAVSSSIGSNIFDILVGLPFPWLLYIIIKGETVEIAADGIWRSIMILIGMILLIIATIHFQGWKLTKTLAYIMFFFYFCFLGQAILLQYL